MPMEKKIRLNSQQNLSSACVCVCDYYLFFSHFLLSPNKESWICKINGYTMQTNYRKIDVFYLLCFSQEPSQSEWQEPILKL